MRSPGAAVLSFAIGIALGVPGLCLLVLLGLLKWRPELAPEWARWLEAHSPLPPGVFPRQLLSDLPQFESLWGAWGAAALLCFIGYGSLRGARDSLRPADQSSGGEAQLLLKTAYPRVGAVLEGDLKLLETPKPGQVFRVVLFCRCTDRMLSKERVSSLFAQSQDIAIAQAGDGWHLPFRFDVPAAAPPSTVRDAVIDAFGGLPGIQYSWFIEFYRADAWFAVPSQLQITVHAAPVDASAEPQTTPMQSLLRGDPAAVDKFSDATRAVVWRILKLLLIIVVVIPLVLGLLLFAANFVLFGKMP